MDKQKQIDEILYLMCEEYGKECGECPCGGTCANELHAERFYNAGYRKIPENAVVLVKEAWDNLQEVLDGKCDFCLERTRKETIKLCRDRVYRVVTKTLNEFFFRGENSKIKACTPIPTNDFVWFDGVMHERVNDCFDEICKEIMEGKV